MTQKAEVFLRRYLVLVERWNQGENLSLDRHEEIAATVADLAAVWACSPKAVRETLSHLRAWSLLAWRPRSGRGQRSALTLLVHPVHVYFLRAGRAERDGRWAEVAFWYGEILADCPCIPGVFERLAQARERLGLGPHLPAERCCSTQGAAQAVQAW